MVNENTICAIATGETTSAIGIIRISGEKSIEILNNVFKSSSEFKDRYMRHGFIVKDGERIDEVMAVGFCGSKTYTGEPMAEIFPHGGKIAMMNVLQAILAAGAILAEPGEFTKRAFMNGKMDLCEAEAVMDFIGSISKTSAKNSFLQLEGKLSKKIDSMQSEITNMLASIEAGIEYPEEDLEHDIKDSALPRIYNLIDQAKELVKSFESGKYIKQGFNVAIVGKPNVGKSSLLNNLIGREKAIVTDIAGTTRDVIEQTYDIHGLPIRYFDTAGIREAKDAVEAIGVERSKKAVENADLVLFVCDSSNKPDSLDDEIYSIIKEKNTVLVLNKNDLGAEDYNYNFEKVVYTSAVKSFGLDDLEKLIHESGVEFSDTSEGMIITNERHKQSLINFIQSFESAKSGFEMDIDLDCVSIDIKDGWQFLGEITGKTVTEDIIDRIFENFCLGK